MAAALTVLILVPVIISIFWSWFQGGPLSSPVEQEMARRSLRECPFCAEEIQPSAILCRYCGRDIEPILPPAIAAPSHDQRTSI
jgi:hypothetical protein